MPDLMERYDGLCRSLAGYGRLAVAFSGGADSMLLLRAAADALGAENVLAVTGEAAFVPERERLEASAYCGGIGVRQLMVPFRPMEVPGFRDNPPERCYLCKRALFAALIRAAGEQGFRTLAEGSNLDDLSDFRPGLTAIAELGVLSPLRDAGLDKWGIRILSQRLGLPTWSKPSNACLATRIPYGEPITEEKLKAVDCAEEFIRCLGFSQVRVRVHGTVARIEVPPHEIEKFLDGGVRMRVSDVCKHYGFTHVSLDLTGYRTGSMNACLPCEALERYHI